MDKILKFVAVVVSCMFALEAVTAMYSWYAVNTAGGFATPITAAISALLAIAFAILSK